MPGLIEAHAMGEFVGEHKPKRPRSYVKCPECGSLMSWHAETCIVCHARKLREAAIGKDRDEGTRDRNLRINAALAAGCFGDLMHLVRLSARGQLPTLEEILECAPDLDVVRWWTLIEKGESDGVDNLSQGTS